MDLFYLNGFRSWKKQKNPLSYLRQIFCALPFLSLSTCSLPTLDRSLMDLNTLQFFSGLNERSESGNSEANRVANPIFSPAAGRYTIAPNVSINSSTDQSNICYTTDGNSPTCSQGVCSNGILFTVPIVLTDNTTTNIRAVACRVSFLDSDVVDAVFITDNISPATVASFTTNPGDGIVSLTWTNPLDSDFSGTKILRKTGGYATDANDATATVVYQSSGASYNDSAVTNGTLYYYSAYAYDLTGNFSLVAQSNATPMGGLVNPPSFTPVAGLYNTVQNVVIATSTSGASICYTTNSTNPTCDGSANCLNGNLYTTPLAMASNVITDLRAIGCRVGNLDSNLTTGNFNIDTLAPADVTAFSVNPGNASVGLTWVNPGDADLDGVRILRKVGSYATDPNDAGAVIAYDGTGTSSTDTGLTNGTTYFYTAYSYDFAGNFSTGVQSTATPVLPAGSSVWARSVTGGGGITLFEDVATDTAGNIYAVGTAQGNGTFDFGNAVSFTGIGDAPNSGVVPILVKYNTNGDALWVRSLVSGPACTGTQGTRFNAVTIDSSDNIIVVGSLYGNGISNFGSGITASGYIGATNIALLVKYQSDGTPLLTRTTVSGNTNTTFSQVTTDSSDQIIVIGNVTGTTTIGFGGAVTMSGGNSNANLILIKYDSAATPLFVRTNLTGGTSSVTPRGVQVDSSDNILISGSIMDTGTYDFGNTVLIPGIFSTFTGFLLKMNGADGESIYGRAPLSGGGATIFYDLGITSSGQTVIAGHQASNSLFDYGNGITLAAPNTSTNPLLVRYNATGSAIGAKSMVSGGTSLPFTGVSIDSFDNSIFCGSQSQTATYTLDPGITATGPSVGSNFHVSKYNSTGTAIWAKTVVSGSGQSRCNRLTTDSSGNIFGVGWQQDTNTFTYGTGVTATATGGHTGTPFTGGMNAVIVKYVP